MAGPQGAFELHDSSSNVRADVKEDGAPPATAGVPVGVALMGYDAVNGVMRVIRVDATGALLITP